MLVYVWLALVFVLGAVVGSFLNVCIARLPLEKSLLWPSSRCGNCLQPIKWYDNIPLVSYLVLGGKCRGCNAGYSIRYFLVELVTGLGFAGLFYLEVVLNIHEWPPLGVNAWERSVGVFPVEWVIGFGFHAILFSFLLVAAVCDLDGREIPLGLTLTGAVVGLVGAVLFPWPWPWTPQAALEPINNIQAQQRQIFGDATQGWWALPPGVGPRAGLYPWPVWGPLPDWLPPGSWQLGLVTGLVGLLVGSLFVRGIAFLFGKGLGKEALGLGDADLMMMAGAFLGWQIVVVAFFVSVFPALFVGIFQIVVRRDSSLPFGPSLGVGILTTMLCWKWIAPTVQLLFFWDLLLIAIILVAAAFMILTSFLLRAIRPPVKA
jgi:leader peptidase (prepilin peptidase)/N-methyltransferase